MAEGVPSRRDGVVDDPALCLRLRPCRAMTRIQDPLNRIRWDREFGKARFAIGYCDRLEKALVRVPFKNISVPGESRPSWSPLPPMASCTAFRSTGFAPYGATAR
jgi:hypothetical protein